MAKLTLLCLMTLWSAFGATELGVVYFFVTTDCPLSNSYAPLMNRLAQEWTPRGFRFYAVQGDATVPASAVQQHAKEFGYPFPVLLDPQGRFARETGATVTPEAAVISPKGKVLYLGRLDNRIEEIGKQRQVATKFELREALEAIQVGRPVFPSKTRAVGCALVFAKQ